MKIPVTNVSGEDREIDSLGIVILAGETVEVDAAAAGRSPTGEPGDEDYDPGEGLLAQPVNWAPGPTPEPTPARAPRRARGEA